MVEYIEISSRIHSVATITEAKPDQLTFCDKEGQKAVDLINNTKSLYIICSNKLDIDKIRINPNRVLFYADNPKLDFVKICHLYFLSETSNLPNTIISPSAKLGSNVSVGSKNVIIGSNTVIHDNVVIYDNVHIGENCIIKSGAVIGGDGYGYVQDIDGTWINFIHYGKVIIKNHVHIGSNTCIDRGSLSDTVIEDGVKIDNLIHVAHNVKIGKNSMVIALSMLGGSCSFGENVWVSPSSSIKDNLTIADNTLVGLGAVVLKDIGEDNVVIGNPAKFYKKRSEL